MTPSHKTILFYDTECNSLDTKQGNVMELAWAVYDISSHRLLWSKSYLCRWRLQYEVDPGAFLATGLRREFCEANGRAVLDVFAEFLSDCEKVDLVGGHNILGFDHLMMTSNVKRVLGDEPKQLLKLPAIDTFIDCPFPDSQRILSLKYLALDHGFVMTNAHQALADVFASHHIFKSYPFEKCLEISKTPMVECVAYTDFHDEKGRELVNSLRFRWDRANRRWSKKCRKYHVEKMKKQLEHISLFVEGETTDNLIESTSQLPLIADANAIAREMAIKTQNEKLGEELPF